MIEQLCSYLLENWSRAPIDEPRPQQLRALVQGIGVGKLCVFLFPDSEPHPQWVAKVARSPLDNDVLKHEYSMIGYARRHGSDFVRSTVPEPLWTTTISGHFVAIEPYYSAHPLDAVLHQGRLPIEAKMRQALDVGIEWLLQSQRETAFQHGNLDGRLLDAHLLAPIAHFAATAALTQAELAYLDRLSKRIIECARRPLPLVFNHGDFRPANMLLAAGRLRVIDWEFASPRAAPLLDVFGILARTHARCHGLEEITGTLEDYLAAFENLFFANGAYVELTAQYVAHACRTLDIHPTWVEPLFALFLIVEANRYFTFLNRRARQGYLYLMHSRSQQLGCTYTDQLARQKHVWLLGYLAEHEKRFTFHTHAQVYIQVPEIARARAVAAV